MRDNRRVVAATRGPELYGMGAVGLLYLVGLAAFLPERLLFPHQLAGGDYKVILAVTVPVLDFTALLLGFRLVLVWMGQIEKM